MVDITISWDAQPGSLLQEEQEICGTFNYTCYNHRSSSISYNIDDLWLQLYGRCTPEDRIIIVTVTDY